MTRRELLSGTGVLMIDVPEDSLYSVDTKDIETVISTFLSSLETLGLIPVVAIGRGKKYAPINFRVSWVSSDTRRNWFDNHIESDPSLNTNVLVIEEKL